MLNDSNKLNFKGVYSIGTGRKPILFKGKVISLNFLTSSIDLI